MPTKVRFLLSRDGRYYARRIVPKELRKIIGKSELRRPLGADRRAAIARLPAALVSLNASLEQAWQALAQQGNADAARRAAEFAPLTTEQLATAHYLERLEFDLQIRDLGREYASIGVDDIYVRDLRAIIAGTLSDDQTDKVLGSVLARFQARGNLGAAKHSPEWRRTARAVADAELNFLRRMLERDEGIAPADQQHPAHLAPAAVATAEAEQPPAVSLRGLLEDHITFLERSGRGRAARKAWPRVFENLLTSLKRQRQLPGSNVGSADDACRLSTEELIVWRDEALATLSAKTVRDVWVAAVKATIQHAVEDRKLLSNPAKDLKVRSSPPVRLRDKWFTDEEATRILSACRAYVPADRANLATRESPKLTAAKRWGPWLCAFTGARVGEVLQLRKSDIRALDDIVYLHITPEAGRVKTRKFRDVPLHPQIIEMGFLEFVSGSEDGPLFHAKDESGLKQPAQVAAGRLSTWLRRHGLVPEGVAPSHGWRHRFKTLSLDLSLNSRVVDDIQGHSGRTASDGYGGVSLKAKRAAIDQLPRYEI